MGFSANGSFPLGDNGTKNDFTSFEKGDVYEDAAVENTNVSLTAHFPIGDVFITSEDDPISFEDGDMYEEEDPGSAEDPDTAGEEPFITSEGIDNYEEEAAEGAVEGVSAEATAKNETGSQRRLRGLYVV